MAASDVAQQNRFSVRFIQVSHKINWVVERCCAALLGAMVLIVWFGIVNRYFLETGVTWTEEAARYLMIWAALLAVSCSARYREHIGFETLISRLPASPQRALRVLTDVLAVGFFIYLTVYGLRMTSSGAHQYATIFGMTMMLPFAAVPVSSALTLIQLVASMLSVSPQALAAETHEAIDGTEAAS
ncbi:TRAP transporter small permease [Motiliproteus sp. SC1-56]|uniref:TRAP transporter small permease n=1 Tax=Motiliproteus sp. SC1-56 TaxID=2799565 RepID=UPI001A8C8F91|nr:TRAP transporter small permease [Motiliproteus sp. SC1-56]